MGKRIMDIICEKVADKLFQKYADRLKGIPGEDGKKGDLGYPGVQGNQGPQGRNGADGWDPYRISFNEPCAEFSWKGVSFIIPFDQNKYSDVEPGVLEEQDAKYIQAIHPELFDKIVLFWYRDYQFVKSKEEFYQSETPNWPIGQLKGEANGS